MGLDTTHNAWHGPYGQFSDWREFIAEKCNIDLNKMEGFSDRNYGDPNLKIGDIPWSSLPPDDIHLLLDHSDCDGEITWIDAGKIARRLNEILAAMKPDDKWYGKTQQFMYGCHEAEGKRESIEFH